MKTKSGILLFQVVTLILITGVMAQRRWGGRRSSRVNLKVGQIAPDFALAPLKMEKDKKGQPVWKIGKDKIKLSTYKGKAPVCIFSSSYT